MKFTRSQNARENFTYGLIMQKNQVRLKLDRLTCEMHFVSISYHTENLIIANYFSEFSYI